MITGWKKLTKEELHHVTSDAACLNDAQWDINIQFQIKTRNDEGKPRCQFCWQIARKLGQV